MELVVSVMGRSRHECSPARRSRRGDRVEAAEQVTRGLDPARPGYMPRYFRMFLPAIRPEARAKAEARPEEPLMG